MEIFVLVAILAGFAFVVYKHVKSNDKPKGGERPREQVGTNRPK